MTQVESEKPMREAWAPGFIDLTRGEDGEYIDESARLAERMMTAARLRANDQEIPKSLMDEIRSTVAAFRAEEESTEESRRVIVADNYAAYVLGEEGIDFVTGKRKEAAPIVGGIILPQERMH